MAKNFKKIYQQHVHDVSHATDCNDPHRDIAPINECACHCYEQFWFNAGYQSNQQLLKDVAEWLAEIVSCQEEAELLERVQGATDE